MGPLARHTQIIDGLRHAERQSRKTGRARQTGLAMTAIQAHYVQYLVWASRGMAMSTLAAHTRTSAARTQHCRWPLHRGQSDGLRHASVLATRGTFT